ncbi:TonB-dependent receptor [Erythrobacter sp. HL-111]|uniref:TonB-dependent receptor n=1 Tax=Erythrobacter sp. HL-111 TaxID=1798193 RepID=UPI0006DB2B7E|nr:TonB-dependent receptor [Erythrobacter sp. HL-111]KPP94814.1 MAG: TonB-dependent receptor [Erythrobacteraceae bacterium HL-111]SDS86406.1 iron complex outermembrane recepter protein [Erythrobacter sp. HL-111]
MTFRTLSRRSIALLLCSCALTPFAAQAQDTDPEFEAAETAAQADEEADEEAPRRQGTLEGLNAIVVTGTKTQNVENVQEVPLAVTAFNENTLEAYKIRDIQGLQFQAPNVSLDQIGTSRGTANFSIRGLGINSSIPSIDPTVGVFVDGVYLGINGGVVFDLFDLDSVEILRGPQGVLFGRNVTGGAVVINTGNPTEDFQGKFRAAVDGPLVDGGRGGANYTTSAVLSGPIIEDKLLFKVGAYYNNDEGYFTNLFDGSNHGQAETYILRGALEGRFGDLTIRAKADYFDSEGDGPSGQNRGLFERDTFDFSIDEPGFYDTEIWTGSLTVDWDLGPGTLTNIFGYRDYSARTRGDIDASPVFLFHSNTLSDQEQYSNELRYAVSTDRLDVTVGGFWFDQTLAYDEGRELPAVTSAEFFGGGRQDHEVIGVFANAEWEFIDDLSLLAGVRWNQETKDGAVTYILPRAPCSVVAGTCPTGTQPFDPATETDGFTDSVRFRNLSPRVGLQYEFANSQIYGSWSRGFRSGGYNFRVTSVPGFNAAFALTDTLFFDEEQVDTFEIGGKFQTYDGVFTLNVAGYVTKIKDMQREVNVADPGAGVVQNILNTADATISGFEAESTIRLSDSLVFNANVGIIDDQYDEILFDISGDGMIDQADFDLRIPRIPAVTWGIGVIHELFLGDSEIVTRVNYQYRDEFAFTDDNLGWIQDISSLEANVTWVTPLDGLSLSVYGRNLLDQVQAGGDTQLPFGGPLSTGVRQPFGNNPTAGTLSPLQRGRNIGIEAMFEF